MSVSSSCYLRKYNPVCIKPCMGLDQEKWAQVDEIRRLMQLLGDKLYAPHSGYKFTSPLILPKIIHGTILILYLAIPHHQGVLRLACHTI